MSGSRRIHRLFAGATLVLGGLVGIAFAQSNTDNSVPNKNAWGENVGWTNWRGEATPGQGVFVGPFVLSGFIWGENIGWINTGDGTPTMPPYYANADGTDFGVDIDADGDLHGYAWGENVGWINFDGGAMATPPQPARIESGDVGGGIAARLNGYAWGENVGWINLDDVNPTKFVALELSATPLVGDTNADGITDALDVQSFVNAMLLGGGSWLTTCSGDLESPADGILDFDDVAPFVDYVLTHP